MSLERSAGRPFGSLVLPVYDAEGFLPRTLASVRAWLARRPEPWELIVVDDGSRDGTSSILDAFFRENEGAAVFRARFARNRGKGFAVRCGLGMARGTYAIFLDSDLAYPIENADRIVGALESGADAAVGCRVLPESTYAIQPSFFHYLYTRHLMGRGFNLLCRCLTVPGILDTQAGLKGFCLDVVRPILPRLVLDGFSFDVELLRALLDRRARIEQVPVSFRYDSEPSTVHFVLDSARMLRDLVRVRSRSLRGAYRGNARGTRRLVVHADDFGMAPGVNLAIERGFETGAITSASILLAGRSAPEALAWAAAHPRFDYGVHLNLTHGAPALPAERVPSLVDSSGRFHPLPGFLRRLALGRIRTDEVRAEWSAQLAAARAAGVSISHLDSHQHVHLFPRFFRSVAVPLAREQELTLRTMDGPAGFVCGRLDWKGILLAATSRLALRGAAAGASRTRGTGTALMAAPDLDVLQSLLRRMDGDTTYELVVHPGHPDDALRSSGDTYVEGRELERTLLDSEEGRAAFRISGIELRDHARDGQLFQGGGSEQWT